METGGKLSLQRTVVSTSVRAVQRAKSRRKRNNCRAEGQETAKISAMTMSSQGWKR